MPAANSSMMPSGVSIPPNQTLYMTNIPNEVKKDELRSALYALCLPFGRVLSVVAMRSDRLRGSAHVCFRDLSSATTALRQLNGFIFYGRPLKVVYAKGKSHAQAKLEGTYRPFAPKSASTDHAAVSVKVSVKEGERDEEDEEDMDMDMEDEEDTEVGDNVNNVLFIENIPGEITDTELKSLFSKYDGFREVRMAVAPGKDEGGMAVAFVDYATGKGAAMAKEALDGWAIQEGAALRVTFAKK